MPSGRFAPSPTGRLHLGNLRTALVAWLFARVDDSAFWLRYEDLDAGSVRAEHYTSQSEDLQAVGLDWDEPVVVQSERLARYREALDQLRDAGLMYPCFCTRRDIREAVQAPNGPGGPWDGRYPGTCRALTADEIAERSAAAEADGRAPAWRMRGPRDPIEFDDLLCGRRSAPVDDVVLCRGDGTPAYNLAATVDDLAQGVELVVRADDLLTQVPTQMHLARCLGAEPRRYAHVPLVLGPGGHRLAKRDGAVTMQDRAALGESPAEVLSYLAETLGLCEAGEPVTTAGLRSRFDVATLCATLPRSPLILSPALLEPPPPTHDATHPQNQ